MIYSETIKKIIICPTCKGEGTVKEGNLREMHNHDTELCSDCNGQGRIKKIKTVEYQKF